MGSAKEKILQNSMTWWNWYCYDCKWKGVAQELGQDFNTEEGWVCPKCNSIQIEDMGWHKEENENTRN